SAESMPVVTQSLLAKEVDEGFCKDFSSISDLLSFLDCSRVVCTKLGLVPKKGTDQFRLICDASENDLNASIALPEHLVLPRVSDAIDSLLSLREEQLSIGGSLQAISVDFSNAFKLVPLMEREKPFHVVFFDGRWYAYNTLLFGVRSSPLIWGREAALISRLASGLCQAPSDHPESSKSSFSLNVFVDDPFAQARAPSSRYARLVLCLPLVLWIALGFRLAVAKRQYPFPIKWIGVIFDIHPAGIILHVPDEKLRSALALVETSLAKVRIPVKLLRKVCGKFAWIGQIVPYVCAFVSPLWGALGVAERCNWSWIHVNQIRRSLVWLKAFIDVHFDSSSSSFYSRVFPCASWSSSRWSIVVDASPFGVGGILYDGASPTSWFADTLSRSDLVMEQPSSSASELPDTIVKIRAFRTVHNPQSLTSRFIE
ncbi:hypothetical protein FOL47_006081, partial [Perkinsus chesapeaki]